MTVIRESFRRDFEHWLRESKMENHLSVSFTYKRLESECVLEGVTFLVGYEESLKCLYFKLKDEEQSWASFQRVDLSKGILVTMDLLELQTKLDNFTVRKILEE